MSSLSKSVSHHFQASSTPCFCPMKCLFPTMCTDRHPFYFSYHCWFSLVPFAVQVINIDSVTSSYCHTLWGFKFEDSLGSQTSQWGQEDAYQLRSWPPQDISLPNVLPVRCDQERSTALYTKDLTRFKNSNQAMRCGNSTPPEHFVMLSADGILSLHMEATWGRVLLALWLNVKVQKSAFCFNRINL